MSLPASDHPNGNGSNASPPPQLPSFSRRLHLQDFMYKPDDDPRRSSRNAAVPVSAPGAGTHGLNARATPTTTPSPRKKSTRPVPKPSPTRTTRIAKSSSPKRKRPSSSYAPPSTYAHLPLLPDAVCENLLVFFVGLNPGIQTARTGHAYAHPSNLFWKLLHSSGVTPVSCAAHEDRSMPQRLSLGFTNIVARPSRNGAELSRQEMDDGVALLEEKARTWRPETMCIVGKSIWESIWRVRHQGKSVGTAFHYGWQDESENMGAIDGEWRGASVFVASSTSGLAATLSPAQKQSIWNELGVWVKKRRAERKLAAEQENAISA